MCEPGPHGLPTELVSTDALERKRRFRNEAWEREATSTLGPMCAHPDCLHTVERQFPGLKSSPPKSKWCPVHEGRA